MPAVNLVENLGNTDGRGLPPEHPLARLPMGTLPPPCGIRPRWRPDREYDRRHIRRILDWWDEQARIAASTTRLARRRAAGRVRARGSAPSLSYLTDAASRGSGTSLS